MRRGVFFGRGSYQHYYTTVLHYCSSSKKLFHSPFPLCLLLMLIYVAPLRRVVSCSESYQLYLTTLLHDSTRQLFHVPGCSESPFLPCLPCTSFLVRVFCREYPAFAAVCSCSRALALIVYSLPASLSLLPLPPSLPLSLSPFMDSHRRHRKLRTVLGVD